MIGRRLFQQAARFSEARHRAGPIPRAHLASFGPRQPGTLKLRCPDAEPLPRVRTRPLVGGAQIRGVPLRRLLGRRAKRHLRGACPKPSGVRRWTHRPRPRASRARLSAQVARCGRPSLPFPVAFRHVSFGRTREVPAPSDRAEGAHLPQLRRCVLHRQRRSVVRDGCAHARRRLEVCHVRHGIHGLALVGRGQALRLRRLLLRGTPICRVASMHRRSAWKDPSAKFAYTAFSKKLARVFGRNPYDGRGLTLGSPRIPATGPAGP